MGEIKIFNSSGRIHQKPHLLRLFVTTYSTSSHRAIQNLTKLLKERYQGTYHLKIIDIMKEPIWAIKENIVRVPLLIKDHPEPSKRLVGDMSDSLKVMASLD